MRTSCCGCILGLAILIFGQIGSGQNTITYTYDVSTPTSPQLHSTHTEQGRVISSTYDSTNHQVDQTSIDSLGHTTTYSYDPNTNTASAGSTISTSGTGISTVYDPANNQLDVTSVDSLGNTTTYAYDATSRVIQSSESISSPGTATSSAYDSHDAMSRTSSTSIPSSGSVTATFYDSAGNIIGVSDDQGTGVSTTYVYDSNGNLLSSITNNPRNRHQRRLRRRGFGCDSHDHSRARGNQVDCRRWDAHTPPTPGKTRLKPGLPRPVSSLVPRPSVTRIAPMDQAGILRDYRELRRVSMVLAHRLAKTLDGEEIRAAARTLGVLQGSRRPCSSVPPSRPAPRGEYATSTPAPAWTRAPAR